MAAGARANPALPPPILLQNPADYNTHVIHPKYTCKPTCLALAPVKLRTARRIVTPPILDPTRSYFAQW